MELFSKDQLRSFISENNLKTAGDAQTALKNLFASTLQEMMEAELETHLGYAKHDTKSKKTTNSRNGKMPAKTVNTELGEIEIHAPRDRQGQFEPQVVKKHQNDLSGMENQIISMYV